MDYLLDSNGWPVMLLSDQAIHTANVALDGRASLFARMPSISGGGQPPAALARVTIMGRVVSAHGQHGTTRHAMKRERCKQEGPPTSFIAALV